VDCTLILLRHARDWNLNQIGAVYGVMQEIVEFVGSFKEFPPRAIPPSFSAATAMTETVEHIREAKDFAALMPKPR
jgi:hypothetical protein